MIRADDSDMILMLIYSLILALIFELMDCVKVKITESLGQFWLNLLQRRFIHKYMIPVSLDSLFVTYITMICIAVFISIGGLQTYIVQRSSKNKSGVHI